MAKKPKKPTLLKYPKKPKQSASESTWINYKKRVDETDAKNRAKVSEWKKKCNAIENGKKKKATIVKALSGLGRAPRVKF